MSRSSLIRFSPPSSTLLSVAAATETRIACHDHIPRTHSPACLFVYPKPHPPSQHTSGRQAPLSSPHVMHRVARHTLPGYRPKPPGLSVGAWIVVITSKRALCLPFVGRSCAVDSLLNCTVSAANMECLGKDNYLEHHAIIHSLLSNSCTTRWLSCGISATTHARSSVDTLQPCQGSCSHCCYSAVAFDPNCRVLGLLWPTPSPLCSCNTPKGVMSRGQDGRKRRT